MRAEGQTPSLWWSRRDEHRWITVLAAAGLTVAAAMAVYGLPPVELHGLLHRFGIMDPLCGGTRAVRYAARGQWALSWAYSPLGIPLVLGAGAVLVRAALGLVSGLWLTLTLGSRSRRPVAWVAAALFVALGLRQQLIAPLLLGP